METVSFSETSPRKYKSGLILVGEDYNRPVYWTWAVCEFVHTAAVCHVCPATDTIFRQLHSRWAQKRVQSVSLLCRNVPRDVSTITRSWHKLSRYPFCGLAVVMCRRRRTWKALVWQLLVADALIIGRCFVFFESFSLTAPVAVLCTLQDRCAVRSAYCQSPSAIFTTASVQISARVPVVLTGFSGFLRYLQTCWHHSVPETRPRPLPHHFLVHSLLVPSLGAEHVLVYCSSPSLRSSQFKSAKGFFFFRNICILLLG